LSDKELITRLGRWTDHQVGTIQRFEAGEKDPTAQVWIELRPRADRRLICDGCGGEASGVHETSERWVAYGFRDDYFFFFFFFLKLRAAFPGI